MAEERQSPAEVGPSTLTPFLLFGVSWNLRQPLLPAVVFINSPCLTSILTRTANEPSVVFSSTSPPKCKFLEPPTSNPDRQNSEMGA